MLQAASTALDPQFSLATEDLHVNIVKAFEHYNLLHDFVPLSGAEQTALDAYTVWLIQRGLLSTTEVASKDSVIGVDGREHVVER